MDVGVCITVYIHPRKLTWNLKITQLQGKIMFQTSILGFHVNFPRCIYYMTWYAWYANMFFCRFFGQDDMGLIYCWWFVWIHCNIAFVRDGICWTAIKANIFGSCLWWQAKVDTVDGDVLHQLVWRINQNKSIFIVFYQLLQDFFHQHKKSLELKKINACKKALLLLGTWKNTPKESSCFSCYQVLWEQFPSEFGRIHVKTWVETASVDTLLLKTNMKPPKIDSWLRWIFFFHWSPFQGTNSFIFSGVPSVMLICPALSFGKDLDLVRKQKEKLDFEQRTGLFKDSRVWVKNAWGTKIYWEIAILLNCLLGSKMAAVARCTGGI